MTKRNQKKGIVPCPPLSVRVTLEEREVLRQHAGERSISDYVRSKLFEDGAPQAAPQTGRLSKHQRQKLMAQTLIRLGELQTPRHLGALTEAIQAGLIDADSELIECINTLTGEFRALRLDLLKALGQRP